MCERLTSAIGMLPRVGRTSRFRACSPLPHRPQLGLVTLRERGLAVLIAYHAAFGGEVVLDDCPQGVGRMGRGGAPLLERIVAGSDLAKKLARLCACHVESNAMTVSVGNSNSNI